MRRNRGRGIPDYRQPAALSGTLGRHANRQCPDVSLTRYSSIVNQSDPARVLIVDDDASQSSAMSQLLGSWGYQVLTACDGRDALDKLTDFSADAVVTDLNMPNLDGQ